MAHTPKTFQDVHIFLQKVKKPPDGFFNNIFFASAIILLFCGLFLHRLSRILKFKLKWVRAQKTDFSRQKFRNRRDNPNSSKPIWKARKKPLKDHNKNRIFVLCTISNYITCHILFSRLKSSEQVVFEYYGSSVIVDNSANYYIFSDKYMFTDKIEPIIYNGVESIGLIYVIPKGIGTFIWHWTDDKWKLHTKN